MIDGDGGVPAWLVPLLAPPPRPVPKSWARMTRVSLHTWWEEPRYLAPVYVLRSRRAAVRFVLDAFEAGVEPVAARVDLPDRSRLMLYPYGHRVVHLTGNERLVARFADLVTDNAGWRVLPQPRPGTPLAVLLPTLGARTHLLLAREGFATVEQVADTPDRALLEIRGLGWTVLTAIRDAVAGFDARRDEPAVNLTGAEPAACATPGLTTLGPAACRRCAGRCGLRQCRDARLRAVG